MGLYVAIALLGTLVFVSIMKPEMLALALIFGGASVIGQVLSNIINHQDILKGLSGSFVGGVLTIAGPFWCVVGAIVNALLNEVENVALYDIDPESFSWWSVGSESIGYTVTNLVSYFLPVKELELLDVFSLYTIIDGVGYVIIDFVNQRIAEGEKQ